MSGPGEYRADCTEGITRVEDLPQSPAGAAQSQLFAATMPEVRSKLLPRSHFRADAARPRRLGAGATSRSSRYVLATLLL